MFETALALLLLAAVLLAFDAGRLFQAKRIGSRLANNAADVALGRSERRRARKVEFLR